MTVKELAQRYAEKPTEARYEALRDSVLDMELQEIKTEIRDEIAENYFVTITDKDYRLGLNRALEIIDKHINVKENNKRRVIE